MSGQEAVDTERTVVTTYVPAYQKTTWEENAEELDMSLSEFVRTMVQAGRRGFGQDTAIDTESTGHGPGTAPENHAGEKTDSGKAHPEGPNPGGSIRETVLQTLEQKGPLSWDELVSEVLGEMEDDLEKTLLDLQEANAINHSPRAGGYTLIED